MTWLGDLGADPVALALCSLVVALGALVQGVLGFGLALLAVPVLAWVAPQTVPVGVLVVVLPLVLVSALRERAHLDARGVGWALVGRVPGGAVGALAVQALPVRGLQLLVAGTVGAAVLAAVVADSRPARLQPVRRTTLALAGALSGLGGTTSGIGGPPMAVAFRNSGGPAIRSTLATFFLLGALLSIGSLALVGEVSPERLAAGLVLLPAVGVGYLLSGLLRPRVRPEVLRVAVLAVSGVAAVALLAEALLG